MADQLTFDDQVALKIGPLRQLNRDNMPSRLTIDQQFALFHELNPWVYDAVVSLARDLRGRGRDRIGIGMLFEVLRWHYWRDTSDPFSEFKLNNNYRSRYARLIMHRELDLAGIFNLRELRSR